MIKPIVFLAAGCGLLSAHLRPAELPRARGPYLGQKPPGVTAELFAPGVVSTGQFEHSSPVFTPDLKEIYWSAIIEENGTTTARPIFFMRMVEGAWSKPEVPSFARAFACSESPFISPDGTKLYFHASPTIRPETAAIYCVERAGDGWGEPVELGEPVNLPGLNGEPTVSRTGTIYFAGGHRGRIVLYFSRLVDGRYRERVLMEEKFNNSPADWTPYIAPDESYLIFCSFREGGFGSGDLYISFRRKDGAWGRVINMGEKINTAANERFPNVTPDGKYLFFNSTRKIAGAGADAPGNGQGDVYWIDAKVIEELKRTATEAR